MIQNLPRPTASASELVNESATVVRALPGASRKTRRRGRGGATPRSRNATRGGSGASVAGRRKIHKLALCLLLLAATAGGALAAEPGSAALMSGRGELAVAVGGEEAYRAALQGDVRFDAVAPLGSDRWVAAGVRGSSSLLLVRGEGSAAERLAVPAAGGKLAASPVPLTADGELIGLAWLAGNDPQGLSVRFARWEGGTPFGSWGEAEVVAPPAPGSQVALAGAVLRDGSAILVWSAFDGQDDEILWSRREAGRWSAPARVAAGNRVPDITPVVAALGDGAVIAWSRFHRGEYQLVTARWTGAEKAPWTAPEAAAGPGSVHPELRTEGDDALLLYRDARRRGWTVLRLDATGRVAARALLDLPSPAERPALLGSDAEGARVAVPGKGVRTLRWQPLP